METASDVRLAELGLGDRHRVSYQASGWLDLRRVLRRSAVSPDDVFLDVGCGKGRILLAAARYPFGRVVGVELSDRLSATARRNVAVCASRRRSAAAEVVTADVAAFRVPDDVTVVYLFNPFTGPLFEAFVAELIASVDRQPRVVRLIYRSPREHRRLVETGRFMLVRVARGWPPLPERDVRLYVLGPVATRTRIDGRPPHQSRRPEEATPAGTSI